MRRLGTEDCLLLAAHLKRDKITVHPLLFFLWHRGCLLAPGPLGSPLSRMLIRGLPFGVLMTVYRLPWGMSVITALLGLLLLLAAIGYWERRDRLSRPLGNIAALAAVVALGGVWLLWGDRLRWVSIEGPVTWLTLAFDLGLAALIYGVSTVAVERMWTLRPHADLPRWPIYVERALVTRLF